MSSEIIDTTPVYNKIYSNDKPMIDHYCDVEGTLHRSVQIFADNGERLKLIWEKNLPYTEHRWLSNENNGQAYIYMPWTYTTEQVIKSVFRLSAKQDGIYQMIYGTWSSNRNLFSNGSSLITRRREVDVYFSAMDINVVEDSDTSLTCNGITENVNGVGNYNQFLGIFKAYGDTQCIRGAFNEFTITESGSVILHLTPALLTRPTLAEEDNNGIARKQGEAVFVDEARYKKGLPWVFGNVVSSGSFSVSDYLIDGEDYEVINGVKSDTESSLVLPLVPNGSEVITLDGDYTGLSSTTTIIWGIDAYPHRMSLNFYQGGIDLRYPSTMTWDGVEYAALWNVGYKFKSILKFNYAELHGNISVKGHTKDVDFPKFGKSFPIFKSENPYANLGTKIEQDGNVIYNLIPVRLLHNIEPTCTHNNKGGHVGEIGFFDTISGKFYGNDGQGEFTEYIPGAEAIE